MSSELEIDVEVTQFVEKLIGEKDFTKLVNIKYQPGSETYDGFTSKTYTVDISDEKKSLHLFVKVPLRVGWFANIPIHKLFHNEVYFYSILYPAYLEFLKERGFEDGFRNVPICYGIQEELIALENLKRNNFRMLPKGKTINDSHFVLATKTFAKFHAVSFAFKDQKRELYDSFTKNIKKCLGEVMFTANFEKFLVASIQDFINILDPVEDKYILDACDNLAENLLNVMLNIENHANNYSIITQGDCWSNNMMYLYEVSHDKFGITIVCKYVFKTI